jgi:hypothetical protein
MSRKPLKLKYEQIEEAIRNSASMLEASFKLGVTYSSFIRYAKKFDLYEPNQGLKGTLRPYLKNMRARLDLDKILVNEQHCTSTRLKNMLYSAGMKAEQCEKCGVTTWNSEKLILHLDHIDGNKYNNRLSNLQILCPNCHSQTTTYCRGQGKYRKLTD